ncbi:MAG TPA: thioredoxin family protein [Thermoanaerobaculia bacterium]|nr:thioredoxin family protein [Thermoanaerobaculia bacterium]
MERTNARSQGSMPLVLIAIAALLIVARIATHFMKSDEGPSDLVNWVELEDATRLAASSNRPVLMDFTAEWCAPCHVLDEEVFRDPLLAKAINQRFIAVRITDRQREDGRNSKEVEALQRRYGVRGFPTVIIADAAGTERGRMEGYGGREQFRRVMESIR